MCGSCTCISCIQTVHLKQHPLPSSQDYFELGVILTRKKLFTQATKNLEKAKKVWDGEESELAQVCGGAVLLRKEAGYVDVEEGRSNCRYECVRLCVSVCPHVFTHCVCCVCVCVCLCVCVCVRVCVCCLCARECMQGCTITFFRVSV